MPSPLTEQDARELIASIDQNLKRWRAWFPNDMSEVEVPRRQLLALKYFAEIGLRTACEKPPKQRCNCGRTMCPICCEG